MTAHRSPKSGRTLSGIALILVLFISALPQAACDLLKLEEPVDKAVGVIDNGIKAIEIESQDWRSVLQRVAADLPREVSEIIRTDAQNLADRAIMTAGVEFRCNVDFGKARAVQSLKNLKAKLLGQTPVPLQPAFCNVSPSFLDLKTDPSHWSTAVLTGYDLDNKDGSGKQLQFWCYRGETKVFALQESRVGRTSHYQITLNLGAIAKDLYAGGITKIVGLWGDSNVGCPQIVIIPWEPRRDTIQAKIGSTGSTGPYTPPHTGGDKDFDTSDSDATTVTLRAELSVTATQLSVRTYMYAREEDPDHTRVEGASPWIVGYQAPAGWKIVSVSPNATSLVNDIRVTQRGRRTNNRPAGEIVAYFEYWVDREGEEAGTYTSVTTWWNTLNVTLEQLKPDWA